VSGYSIDNKDVQSILSKYNLGGLDSLEEMKSGSINPVFLINDKYILRIDLGNSEYKDKLKKESILFNILPKFSIPTPKLIAFDDTRELIKYSYILMSYLKGQNLKDIFITQSKAVKSQLSLELGILVNKIHSVIPDDLDNLEIFSDINSWVGEIKRNYKIYWTLIKENNFFSNNIDEKIEKIFSDYEPLSGWDKIARLTHGDINPRNIRVKNGHIVGIFDFEYSRFADPLGDLERLSINFELGADFDRKAFLIGYELNNITDSELKRIKMYCLSQGLWEIWATKTQKFPYGEKEIEEGKQLVLNTINLRLDH